LLRGLDGTARMRTKSRCSSPTPPPARTCSPTRGRGPRRRRCRARAAAPATRTRTGDASRFDGCRLHNARIMRTGVPKPAVPLPKPAVAKTSAGRMNPHLDQTPCNRGMRWKDATSTSTSIQIGSVRGAPPLVDRVVLRVRRDARPAQRVENITLRISVQGR
jgi:hypothetical protein